MQGVLRTSPEIEDKKIHASITYEICAFVEKPSLNYPQKKENSSIPLDNINASELFSFFTADIIKEKIVFTR